MLIARHFASGEWVRLYVQGSKIAGVEPAPEPETFAHSSAAEKTGEDWVGPAFWDIQFNGRWGVSFSDPNLTSDQAAEIIRAQGPLGSARVCPTLITAARDAFLHGLRAIARACAFDREVAAIVVGIHLEGPYISSVDGYRGAHPLADARDPDWDEFRRFQDAAEGRITLVTLAPERPGAIDFIKRAVAAGVTIAIGHTAADNAALREAADAGATLSTHLGNGIASPLPRHPNPIWDQLAIDSLSASFIADGHHVDLATLRALVRAKGIERTILVSDASPLAGLPPGTHGEWAVHRSGKIVVAGTPYLAGSNQSLETCLNNLIRATGVSDAEAFATATTQPARLLRKQVPALAAGQAANLVIYQREQAPEKPITLKRVCVEGRWMEARDDAPSPWAVSEDTAD
jgi:N-acetylglucosamine-6-phosphate deacetylase